MKVHVRHASRAQRGPEGELPRPFAAALPYAVLVPPAALAAAVAGLIVWPLAVALAGAALVAALVRAAVEHVRKARQRSWADAWLLGTAWRRPPTAVLDARREELVSDRQRRMLAGSLRHLVRESRRFALPGASPANFRAVFAHAENLEALALRLEASGPVSRDRGRARPPALDRPRRAALRSPKSGRARLRRPTESCSPSTGRIDDRPPRHRHQRRLLRLRPSAHLRVRPGLMRAENLVMLLIAIGIFAYLVFVLFRGDRL